MELTELTCKRCGAPIKEQNIHWDLAMARCSHCGTVFGIKGQADGRQQNTAVSYKRQSVPMPKQMQISDDGIALEIVYRWFSSKFIFLIFFTIFWNMFLLFWHGTTLVASHKWAMSLFALPHTLISIGLIYYTVAGFLNYTIIHVELGELSIRHRPLPWPGHKQLMATNIEQLYSREKVSRSRNGINYSYQVYAILHNGTKEKLLGGFSDPDQALYVEQELERHLRIQDRPVRGEIPR